MTSYIAYCVAGIYFLLALFALSWLCLPVKPFTCRFSEGSYPPVISRSANFLKLNQVMSAAWGGLFLLGAVLSVIPYSSNSVLQLVLASTLPVIVFLGIGLPMNRYLPDWLMQHAPGERMQFASVAEAGEAMPYGLSKKLSKGVDAVIQFELTGEEAGISHLAIKNQACTYTKGAHPHPTTRIKADPSRWLDVINNRSSGDRAFIEHQLEVEGDASILLNFADLFAPQNLQDVAVYEPRALDYTYASCAPGRLKKVVVFDGGPRGKAHSKTTFMVDQFLAGAKDAGAEVVVHKLAEYKIHPCTGCFTCWTQTPGSCIFNDDMTDLRNQYRDADLVVFASPLYIFSVTGVMKNFMDRLLPLMKPYMLLDEHGYTKHPDRYPEKGTQGFVVFSAAGFPDVDHNFDGLQAMYRMWAEHSENAFLMGEFFMPAAEMIVQPVYAKRRQMIADACFAAGKEAVERGKINPAHMQAVSFPGVTRTRFQQQADSFWSTLDGKARYLREVPTIGNFSE